MINVSLDFNRKVKVRTVNGLPKLGLGLDGGVAYAFYLSGDNSSSLVFNYTVAEGDAAGDLNYTNGSALVLDGGVIYSASDVFRNAVLTLPVGADSLGGVKNITVDGVKPVINVSFVNETVKKVFAVDDDSGITVMKYKIQASDSCSATVPDDSLNYSEGDNVTLNKSTYNNKYVCFWSADAGGNVGKNVSALISGIDNTAPSVTVSSITGAGVKVVSATDDDSGATTMKYKIQASSACSATVPGDASDYNEGDNVSLDQESYNGKYVCFWSTDQGGNAGKNVSDQISGIDTLGPSVTVSAITGTGVRNVSATDDDSGTTTMKYKIQASSACSATVPGDASDYNEGDNVSLDQESYNGQHVCFWSTDQGGNVGKAASSQITGIDKTAPLITVSGIINVAGSGGKAVSATDDDSAATVMKYKIQTGSSCSNTVPSEALNYSEGNNISLDSEDHNSKYVCFWSTDQGGNVGKAASPQITGIDKTAPTITVSPITGLGDRSVSATDDDSAATLMKYKIQPGSACSNTVPGDALDYSEGASVSLDQESYNGQHVCFWSTDAGGNVGKNVSAQISGVDKTAPSVTVNPITRFRGQEGFRD